MVPEQVRNSFAVIFSFLAAWIVMTNLMGDRGFDKTEELMLKYCSLSVSPGAKIKLQKTNSEVGKTQKNC